MQHFVHSISGSLFNNFYNTFVFRVLRVQGFRDRWVCRGRSGMPSLWRKQFCVTDVVQSKIRSPNPYVPWRTDLLNESLSLFERFSTLKRAAVPLTTGDQHWLISYVQVTIFFSLTCLEGERTQTPMKTKIQSYILNPTSSPQCFPSVKLILSD